MAKAKKESEAVDEGMSGAPATMKPEIVVFTITGRSPLLQNNPANFIGKTDGDGGLAAGKKSYNNDEEAKLRVYLDDEGQYLQDDDEVIEHAREQYDVAENIPAGVR